jgi:ParB/RepB/Spo0J family partition protein
MITEFEAIEVKAWEMNPRKRHDKGAHAQLMESMRNVGWFGSVVGRPHPEGGVELVFGERRLRAAQALGLRMLVDVRAGLTDKEAIELAVIENRDREDLDVIEEAGGYAAMISAGWTIGEIAARSGRSADAIYLFLDFLGLEEPIQEALRAGEISQRTAKALGKIEEDADRAEALRRVLEPRIQDHPLTQSQALPLIAEEYLEPQKRRDAWRREVSRLEIEGEEGVRPIDFSELSRYTAPGSSWVGLSERPATYELAVHARLAAPEDVPTWGALASKHGAERVAIPDARGKARLVVDKDPLIAAEIAAAEIPGGGGAAKCVFPMPGRIDRHEQSVAAKHKAAHPDPEEEDAEPEIPEEIFAVWDEDGELEWGLKRQTKDELRYVLEGADAERADNAEAHLAFVRKMLAALATPAELMAYMDAAGGEA